MDDSEKNKFETELKISFLEEATQLLESSEQCFLTLESQPNNSSILENIFRIAHNIKGSSRAVGFDHLGSFTHEFESFLLKCKSGQTPLNQHTITLMLKCNDHVNRWITALREDLSATLSNDELIAEIQNYDATEVSKEKISDKEEPETSSASIHPLDLEASEQIPIHSNSKPTPPSTDESIRVSLARLEKLLNYIGELVILQTVLREQSHAQNQALFRRTIHQMGKVTKEVQDLSMSLRMVPIKQNFQKMQRIVRDTGSALGKKVNFSFFGEETEVDKTVLENLSDPLVHLVRNAVDHGIEKPELRIASKKPECGEIALSATHQGGSLVIEIRDDGAGIDANRLRQKALEKGILKQDASISDKEAYELIFHSGFSTKEVVTDVSGRGVGMDVVKTNIEQLQGEIQIETELGKGTCFRIRLPLTLAIIDGLIIRSQTERYVVPLSHVHESLRLQASDLHFMTGVGEMLLLRGEKIPLFRLSSLLSKNGQAHLTQEATAIVIRNDDHAFSIVVDDIVSQSQIVIKQLGPEHRDLRGISGSAILGDGKPALILELSELVKRTRIQTQSTLNARRVAA